MLFTLGQAAVRVWLWRNHFRMIHVMRVHEQLHLRLMVAHDSRSCE
jgi:hypothetical protein